MWSKIKCKESVKGCLIDLDGVSESRSNLHLHVGGRFDCWTGSQDVSQTLYFQSDLKVPSVGFFVMQLYCFAQFGFRRLHVLGTASVPRHCTIANKIWFELFGKILLDAKKKLFLKQNSENLKARLGSDRTLANRGYVCQSNHDMYIRTLALLYLT